MGKVEQEESRRQQRLAPDWARFRLKGPGVLVYSNQPVHINEASQLVDLKGHKEYLPTIETQVKYCKFNLPFDLFARDDHRMIELQELSGNKR